MIRNLILYFFLWLTTLVCNAQQISSTLDSIHQLNPEDDYGNIHLYDSLLTHYKKTKNYTQLGSDAHQLAKWLSRENQLYKTIEILKTGIAARKKAIPFNPELLKRSYANLGNYYNLQKSYHLAIQAYSSMIKVKESSAFNELSYSRLGNIYFVIGDYYKAIDSYSQSVRINNLKKDPSKAIRNHFDLIKVYRNLIAYGYQEKDNKTSKIIKHLNSIDSLIKIQTKPSLKDLYYINLELGLYYFKYSSKPIKDKAIFHFEKALTYANQTNNKRRIIGCYLNLGQALLLAPSNLKKSEDYFFKALKLGKNIKKLESIAYVGLASLAEEQENQILAKEYYQKSLSYELNSDNTEISLLKIKESLNSKNKNDVLELFKAIIRTDLKRNEINRGIETYKSILETVKISDSILNNSITENISFKSKLVKKDLASEFLNMGLEACLYTNNLDDAFYLMEKSKAVLLMNDIQQQIRALPTDVASKKTNYDSRIQQLQNELLLAVDSEKDSLTTLIKQQKEQYILFKDSIEDIYPTPNTLVETPKILPLCEVSVKENEVIIQYSMAERSAGVLPNAYVMTLTKHTQKMFEISNVDILIEDIKTLRKLLDQPFTTKEDITTYRKTSNDIYNALFPKEIRAALKGKKVTIIPDHIIGMIPFEALVANLDNNTYLIKDCEINYAFSLTFQQQNAKISRTAAQDFLGIAPVNFKQELTPLQNSNKEITVANAFYNGDLLLDQEATKENFIKKIKDYKILHLATHADASDSIAPWIAFRNSKLTDLELNSLQSQAELVVLSACNTSLGKISRGEGILSLARGFFKSGASTVIPSLWSTNDKATATITADFYKNLSKGQTKSEALRSAKLNYLHNNTDAEASPHYWASMILIGDTGTLLPQSNDLWMFLLGFGIVIVIILCLFLYRRKKD